jgi:hypothetical protein
MTFSSSRFLRWDGAEYYGPKWGLYRRKSSVFNDSDYIFFQNVQIWKD